MQDATTQRSYDVIGNLVANREETELNDKKNYNFVRHALIIDRILITYVPA